MKITSRGRVTIPVEIREQCGLRPGDEIKFVIDEHGVRVVKDIGQATGERRRAESLLKRGDIDMTTEEIMALTCGE
ncbi:AbrB/MazE/SpoVT family DNA-binding domain-containing protein [Kutzneria sp. NPDC052558]|uniref:AbrB/MazE/SpoVT family DNA-binding domain-containing protein n=1 Tax=Kutzneria sp. NPDC052558 TaxID=3364121 RepID=UPI0037CC17C5